MEEDEKLIIELTPFDALTVMVIISIFEKKLPEDDKIRLALANYNKEIITKISPEQMSEAFIEKEIYEALLKNK